MFWALIRLKLRGSLRSDDVTVPPRVGLSENTIATPPSSSTGRVPFHQRQPTRATTPISRTLSNARGCRFTSCPVGQFIGRFSFSTAAGIFCDLHADLAKPPQPQM